MNYSRSPNWFTRILVILFVAVLLVVVGINFFLAEPKYSITPSAVLILAMVLLLVLSEGFNNLSLGRLVSLSREVTQVKDDNAQVRRENADLRQTLMRVVTSVNQSQQSTTIIPFGHEFRQLLGVEVAEPAAEDAALEEALEVPPEPPPEARIAEPARGTRLRFATRRRLDEETLERYIAGRGLNASGIEKRVQFTTAFEGLDPIMERKVTFDAYSRAPTRELFIEAMGETDLSPFRWDRLYVMLSKILRYREAKGIDAQLALALYSVPGDEDRPTRWKDRFLEAFQPAIANNLLRVETHHFTRDEVEAIEAEMGARG